MIQAYAVIRVPTPGTPVRVTKDQADPAAAQGCHGVLIQALPGNTGKIYIGGALLNAAAFTGLYALLAIPTVNQLPTFSAALTISPGGIQLRDFYIDAEIATDGVIVTALVT